MDYQMRITPGTAAGPVVVEIGEYHLYMRWPGGGLRWPISSIQDIWEVCASNLNRHLLNEDQMLIRGDKTQMYYRDQMRASEVTLLRNILKKFFTETVPTAQTEEPLEEKEPIEEIEEVKWTQEQWDDYHGVRPKPFMRTFDSKSYYGK
jgi:hypothetical protein